MTDMDASAVAAGFGAELAAVIGALFETDATIRRTDAAPETACVVSIEVVRGGRGSLQVYVDRAAARALSRRLRPDHTDQDEAAWLSAVKEVCGQAVTSLVGKNAGTGARLSIAYVRSTDERAPESAAFVEIVLGLEADALRLALAGTLELGAGAEPDRSSVAVSHPGLDMILDIDLPLTVRLGRTEMSLKILAAIGPGSLIDFGRSPDDPVDVLVSSQVIATGDVVVVGGHYGVRIREVASAAARVQTMEVVFR